MQHGAVRVTSVSGRGTGYLDATTVPICCTKGSMREIKLADRGAGAHRRVGVRGQVMQTAPLNVLDELYLHLDRDEEPWSVHVEIRAEGHIDAGRLESAVREAALRHPIARARLAETRVTDVRYQWEIADELGEIELEETDGDLAAARERLLGRSPALDAPGPFALLLSHASGGDVLVLNLHHAAGDGLSALRL